VVVRTWHILGRVRASRPPLGARLRVLRGARRRVQHAAIPQWRLRAKFLFKQTESNTQSYPNGDLHAERDDDFHAEQDAEFLAEEDSGFHPRSTRARHFSRILLKRCTIAHNRRDRVALFGNTRRQFHGNHCGGLNPPEAVAGEDGRLLSSGFTSEYLKRKTIDVLRRHSVLCMGGEILSSSCFSVSGQFFLRIDPRDRHLSKGYWRVNKHCWALPRFSKRVERVRLIQLNLFDAFLQIPPRMYFPILAQKLMLI
jgi:hypothetical protein